MKLILIGIAFLSSNIVISQNDTIHQDIEKHHLSLKVKDSTCLKDCFLQAHWEAHTRTFFMSTINEGKLKDDYALATGAGIGLLTKPIYGFQVGVSGFLFTILLHQRLNYQIH